MSLTSFLSLMVVLTLKLPRSLKATWISLMFLVLLGKSLKNLINCIPRSLPLWRAIIAITWSCWLGKFSLSCFYMCSASYPTCIFTLFIYAFRESNIWLVFTQLSLFTLIKAFMFSSKGGLLCGWIISFVCGFGFRHK